MFRYTDTQEQLPKRKAWTHKDSGVQYCRRFLESCGADDLASVGVEYIADPEPPQPTQEQVIRSELGRLDNRLVMMAARMIEDMAEERISNGKFVAQAIQDIITERKAKRTELQGLL